MEELILGTRGSKLARAQSELVATALQVAHPGLRIHIKVISTLGDRRVDVALSKIGDKGVFVKELEIALLRGEIDLAVHSAKDLPSDTPDGLRLAAYLRRGDVRDVIVVRDELHKQHQSGDVTAALNHIPPLLAALPTGSRVGTGSLRRAAQVRSMRADVQIVDIRGNVDRRLAKLVHGDVDALLLATAGLQRLSLMSGAEDDQSITLSLDSGEKLIAAPVSTSVMLPAAAQGALAIEIRINDHELNRYVAAINDPATEIAVRAERGFLHALDGGCQAPMAAFAKVVDRDVTLFGMLSTLDGTNIVHGSLTGTTSDPEILARTLADSLRRLGATAILASLTRSSYDTVHGQPLAGKRVLVTRAAVHANQFANRLRQLGAEPILYPMIAYSPAEDADRLNACLEALCLNKYDWLIITSVTSVDVAAQWRADFKCTFPEVNIAAIGAATAEACAAELGSAPRIVADRPTPGHLLAKMGTLESARVLILNSDVAKPDLELALTAAGARVDRAVAYQTHAAPKGSIDLPALLASNAVDAITFTSGSTVEHFVSRLSAETRQRVNHTKIICIGPATAAVAASFGLTVAAIAAEPSETSMITALIEVL